MADLQQVALGWAGVWGCTVTGAPVVTTAALLLPAVRDGVAVMIKVSAPGNDEGMAAAVLAALDGQGSVRLLASGEDALLMERITRVGPGLEAMALGGADEAATRVLCDLASGVRQGLRGVTGLEPLDRRMAVLTRPERLDPAMRPLARWAAGLAGGMLADRSGWTGLHGDLHHFNALQDARRGWLVIDPKGVFGPPVYDLANTLLNPFPHEAHVTDPARMLRQAGVVAGHLEMPVNEVLRWACLHGCLAAAWDGAPGYWSRAARVAGRVAGLDVPE